MIVLIAVLGNKSFETAVIYNDAFKGEMMRKHCLRILIVLFSFAGLGIAARAQVRDQVAVTIPFDFVIGGKTLPAGTYKVNRVTDTNRRILILHSFDNHTSALVVPSQIEDPSTDKVYVSFERVGGQYFLSKIATADDVFTIPMSRSATVEVAARNSAPASNGSGSH
jgi:hypothetical protein